MTKEIKCEQLYDGRWANFDDQFYLMCCECGSSHSVKIKPRKGGGYRMKFLPAPRWLAQAKLIPWRQK